MDIDSLRAFCLSLPHTTEDLPFDEHTLVFRIGGKIFAILPLDTADSVNLKCDPERAIFLREHYEDIRPGYHMNKRHWNTIRLNGQIDDRHFQELIHHSYTLVYARLPQKLKAQLQIQA